MPDNRSNIEWPSRRLGDICLVNPDKRDAAWPYDEIEYIDISSVGTGMFTSPPARIAVSEAPSRAQRLVKPGDTILATVRPNLRSFVYLSETKPNTVVSTGFAVLRATEESDKRFLYYIISDQSFTDYLTARAHGSAYPAVSVAVIQDAELRVPLPDVQESIGAVLGALDDKIKQNRRTARALERLARAIFRAWFVDFEPVKAKAAGATSFPSMPQSIFDALPAAFADSELGPIPNGWGVRRLGDAIALHDSKRIPLSRRQREQRRGRYRYYGAAGIIDYVNDYLFDGVYVLVGEDGTVITDDDRPVVQYVWGQFWVNNHAHVLTGTNGFTTEHLRVLLDHVHIRPFVTGAVQPKLNQANLKSVPIVIAPNEVNRCFADTIGPLFELVRGEQDESASLAKTRDYLLPKLLSGQVRVAVANG